LLDIKDVRRTSGSRLLSNHVATETAEIVTRSSAAGLLVMGKTNTPEFALNASTESLLSGPACNPWNTAYSPGGSSGGAAVAVASGMLAMAHASDGGGSIRIPASCCGLFGLKPSRGRMRGAKSSDGGVEHCLSRSVRDSARLFAWNQRRDADAALPPVAVPSAASKRRLKIAFALEGVFGNSPSSAVKTALENTALLCDKLGHHVERAYIPVDGQLFFRHFMSVWCGSAARAWQLALQTGQNQEAVLEPWTNYLARHARSLPSDAGIQAADFFFGLAQDFSVFFEQYDVLLTPVTDRPPPLLGYLGPTVAGEQMWQRLLQYASYTPIHNAAGTPAMSVPLGFSPEGLPIGSQFAARLGDEQSLFELAFELEQAQPWAQYWPGTPVPKN
jgi:amidase